MKINFRLCCRVVRFQVPYHFQSTLSTLKTRKPIYIEIMPNFITIQSPPLGTAMHYIRSLIMLAARPLSVRILPVARSSFGQPIPIRRWKQTSSSEPPATPLTASSDDTESVPLEKLSRPLGIRQKPSAATQSWEEKKADMLDYDKHIERRRHL